MKKVVLFVVAILLLSCHSKDTAAKNKDCAEKPAAAKKKKFEMYAMSEMSVLMEQMYLDNERLKERIKNGDTIGEFPNHFLRIHKAVMTDTKENDAFFKEQAANFIKAQEQIYLDPKNAAQHFNKGIDACIKCHQVKCGGPIPRIKKLYIE
ncbi:MAG TPA: hypothetical protein VF676_00780 [Flavobacterium sp.]|jgi:hypothetical protein